jgi:hypothetical protein
MLNIIQRFMTLKGWKFSRLDGDTNIASRQRLVDSFNGDDSNFAMLCTTRTGGVGLNLTGADRIILYDPDWNPQTGMLMRLVYRSSVTVTSCGVKLTFFLIAFDRRPSTRTSMAVWPGEGGCYLSPHIGWYSRRENLSAADFQDCSIKQGTTGCSPTTLVFPKGLEGPFQPKGRQWKRDIR